MQSTIVSLASRDPRLHLLASVRFPRSPELVEWLTHEVRTLNGNLDVLDLICTGITDLRGHLQPASDLDKACVDRWRDPLVDKEALLLRTKLLERYPNLDVAGMVLSYRLEQRLTSSVKDGVKEVDAQPRLSVDQNFSVAYIRLFFRILALLDQVERPSLH
jgi:hypothetical protein